MRKIIEVAFAAAITLLSIVPLVSPSTGTATASVSVLGFCDIAATGPIDFTTLTPGSTSSDVTSTVYEPTGNANSVSVTISGVDWTNAGPTMPVNQTHWLLSTISNYNTTNQLHLSPGDPLGGTIGSAQNQTVHFMLQIPVHQAAVSYTQTITFTACGV